MGKIPLPDNTNPGRIQGDRLATASPDLAAPGRALQGFGRAVQGLGEQWQADQDKMDGYNANLAMEKFASGADIAYQQNLQTSAPDGTDFVQKQEQALIKSYEETLKGIKRPEDQARFANLFERIRGNQVVKGMQDSREKGKSYVLATTNDSLSEWVKSGALKGEAEYNDYFENSIKPRIDSVVDDPLERQKYYGIVGKNLRDNFFRQNPQVAMPKVKTSKVDTAPMSKAITSAAAELGIPAVDLATVISYETGGRFSTSIMGGKGGNYMGLIQFGPEERARYGAKAGQSFDEQMGAVVRYLKDRGLKPGMSIYDLYSTINAGTPGRYGASDGPGNTVKGHVDKMLASAHRKKAEALVGGQSVEIAGSYEAPPMPQDGIFEGMDQQEWDSYVKQGRTVAAKEIATSGKDELASLEFTGDYQGRSLTEQDFVAAYGEEGLSRFEAYDDERATAKQKNAYQSMSSDEILADINAKMEAVPEGEGSANYVSNLAELQKTAKEIISYRDRERGKYLAGVESRASAAEARQIGIAKDKQQRFADLTREKVASVKAAQDALVFRQKDPAGYVFQTNADVRRAWRNFNPRDPDTASLAIAETIAAQEAIGIPPEQVMPLPMAQAEAVAEYVTDNDLPPDKRMDALIGTVYQTDNPDHRRAIFRQMAKAGVPRSAEVAVDAYERNDPGAAKRIFEASVLPNDKTPGKGAREPGFADAVDDALFDAAGSAIYGFDYSSPAGSEMAKRDAGLVATMATLNMLRGKDQATAISEAIKDIRGDVTFFESEIGVEGNVRGVIPNDVNPDALKDGMSVAMNTVRTALTDMAQRSMMQAVPDAGADAMAVRNTAINNALASTLEEGQFRNYQNGWAFYDPYTSSFVPGRDGKPLMWTTEQFLTMQALGRGAAGGGSGF
jgi:hypothetical protein